MTRLSRIAAFLSIALLPMLAFAQGMVVPHVDHIRRPVPHPMPHPMPRPIQVFSVTNVSVEATIKDQVAQVQLSQSFRNASSVQMEVTYLFPIPEAAVIERFTLMVDGKEMPAKLYTKDEARQIYESIVRSQRDPAILEYMGTGALQTQVFPVPANAERQVVLKYTQVCRRDSQATEFVFPLGAGKLSNKPIEELKFNIRIDNPKTIKSVYCPTHSVDVKRPSDTAADVTLSQKNVATMEDLRILWTLSEKPIGATLLSYRPDDKEDGYFMLLAAPEVKRDATQAIAKTVIFALDKSGSMISNKKIDQAKGALSFVLKNLNKGDAFNIIDFNDKVETFKPELQAYDDKTRDEAQRYVDNIYAGGSTNINGALQRALELSGDGTRPTYLIFLTDGRPTVGEQNEAKIADNASSANKARVRFFVFGVGNDLNARLLDRLATDNFGTTDFVRPNEDIEGAVSKLYSKMISPVLAQPKVELAGTEIRRTYPKVVPDLFAGQQIIWVGRYKTSGDTKIKLVGKVGPEEKTFEFDSKLAAKGADETYAFVEKLWATRRVGEMLNEMDLKGQNKELMDELVGLSLKHGILTPYTAFLADERTVLGARAENAAKAGEAFRDQLGAKTDGADAVNLRVAKGAMQQAAAPAAAAGVQSYMDESGRMRRADNCQVVANRALFKRNNRWVDPTVTEEDEKKAIQVEQFSDKYFELARDNAQLRKFLAMPEGCTIRVDEKIYQINAPQAPRG